MKKGKDMFRTGLLELCVSLTLKSDTMGVAWREEKNHDSHCEVKFQQQFVKLLSRFYLTECLGSLGDSDIKNQSLEKIDHSVWFS